MERFINATLSFTFGWTKTEVFEYANVIRYINDRSSIVFLSFCRFHVDGWNRVKYTTCGRVFFEEKENNLLFRKYVDKFGKGPTGHCRNLVYTVYTLRTSHAKKFYLLNPPIMTSLITYAIFSVSFSASPCVYPRRGVSQTSSSTLPGLFCTSRRWHRNKVPRWVWEVPLNNGLWLPVAETKCNLWILIRIR